MKLMSLPLAGRAAGVLADSINDVSSTRKVYLLAAGLALLGIVLILITVWFWRTTRHDPEVLGPLEAMGTRKFRTMDDGSKQEMLEHARPADAEPMKWGIVRGTAMEQPKVDLGELERSEPKGYDDLREPVDAAAIDALIASLDLPSSSNGEAGHAEPVEVNSPDDDEVDVAVDPAAEPAESEASVNAAASEVPSDSTLDGAVSSNGQPIEPDVVEPVVEPLVIAPLDLDLPERPREPVVPASAPVEPVAEPAVAEHDETSVQSRVAIDPLLRRMETRD